MKMHKTNSLDYFKSACLDIDVASGETIPVPVGAANAPIAMKAKALSWKNSIMM